MIARRSAFGWASGGPARTMSDWLSTRYEAVCGQARTDCSAGVRVVAPDGRPTCDPEAPELDPVCAGGGLAYCHFADCREGTR